MRASGTIAAVALSALLSAGCGVSAGFPDVVDVEATLQEHYLQPLSDAGITSTIERTCRYSGPAEGPWILITDLHLDASVADVLQTLRAHGVQVRDQEVPASVQQIPGQPDQGWDGTIASADAGSALSLRRYSVVNTPAEQAKRWSSVCPETVHPDLRDPAPEPSTGGGA